MVLDGEMHIEMEDRTVNLCAGELFVVPRGKRHHLVAAEECLILLFERKSTKHMGNWCGIRLEVSLISGFKSESSMSRVVLVVLTLLRTWGDTVVPTCCNSFFALVAHFVRS